MKLYTLEDNRDRILAITSDKRLIKSFYLQNDYINTHKDYVIKVYKDKKTIKNIRSIYINENLVEWKEDCIVREVDIMILREAYENTKSFINKTIDDLQSILEFNIKKKDKKVLNEAIEVLDDYTSKKKLKKIMSYRDLILLYYTDDNYRNTLLELDNSYKNSIR